MWPQYAAIELSYYICRIIILGIIITESIFLKKSPCLVNYDKIN
jgi:hypothetical protein